MIQDEFKFYKPCKLLQPYVRYYWVFKSNQLLNTLPFLLAALKSSFTSEPRCIFPN